MGGSLFSAIVIVVLACIFIYLIMWTVGFFSTGLKKKRTKQKEESKEKIESIRLRTIGCSKNYWYNKQDVEDCNDNKQKELLYHYFNGVDDCIMDLVVEMYDCALVRTEELSRIAYGESVFEDKIEEIEPIVVEKTDITEVVHEEVKEAVLETEEPTDTEVEKSDEADLEVETTKTEPSTQVVELTVEQKRALEADEDAVSYKEELDAIEYTGLSEEEKRRKVAIKASIYEHWVGYVFQLYQIIDINANEDLKNRIRKELMHYGYNDIEVLLHSPE